jgi:hypothetical protein
MARITGKNGTIKIGSTPIANITDWSLDAKIPLADATAMQDAFATKLSLIREWSGTVKGIYGNAAEAVDILNSFLNATTSGGPTSGKVTVHLMPDAAGTEDFYGDCYMDFALSVDKGKANEFTAKFTGTGALSHTA